MPQFQPLDRRPDPAPFRPFPPRKTPFSLTPTTNTTVPNKVSDPPNDCRRSFLHFHFLSKNTFDDRIHDPPDLRIINVKKIDSVQMPLN
jgi:hypothetical protein